jgi:carbon storage regulator CsrA
MLVLSRRQNEKVCFPDFRTVVQILNLSRGAVRLGIEAPPEITVLREEVQALPVVAKLPEPQPGAADHEVAAPCLDSLLAFGAAGLEQALNWLKAGRTRDAQALLDTMQEDIAHLRRLRRHREPGPRPTCARPRQTILAHDLSPAPAD